VLGFFFLFRECEKVKGIMVRFGRFGFYKNRCELAKSLN
jgi:hypothetical protein